MKNNFNLKYPHLCAILIVTLLFSKTLQAQQSLISVNGWNAYVHLPWDYSANPSKTYPTIIFFPGIGEVGSDASLVIANGPGAYIKQGWNGNVKVGTDSIKFIVISLQPPSTYPRENTMNTCIQTLKGLYRIDNSRLHLTGLSMGGWCTTTFVTGDAAAGPYTYASQVATVVEVEGMKPADNAPYPNMFDNFANSNGRLLGFEQVYDSRDILTRVNRMNATKPNSGIFVSTNFGSGGHCCWEQFYGGSGVTPTKFTLDGISQNIYEWMARNPLPTGVVNNQLPLANAGSDMTNTLPVNSVSLNGSGSDADGTIKSYAWAKASGPSSGSVASANTASTAVNNLVQGVYKFVLTVADNSSATANDTVQVTVNPAPNQAPTATAGNDMIITLPLNSVTLNGSASDADGTIKSYAWSKASGPSSGSIVSANTASTAVNNLVQGVYKFVLTVADNSSATVNDTVQITVNPAPNQAPLANAGNDITITLPVNSVTLNGSGSDADGTIKSYAWSKASGPSSGSVASANTASTAVNNLVQGVYKFVLTVADNSLATANDTVQVTVNPAPNQPPLAAAGSDVIITLPLNSVTLNGSASDADGTIKSYAWAKASGPSSGSVASANTASTAVNNLVQGVYKFVLTVADNSLATANDTVQITVNPAPNQAPLATAGSDVTITLPVNSVMLNGSGSDADGTIKSYAWAKASGPSSGSIASANTASTAVNNLVQGVYKFVLTVADNSLATANDTVQVTVNAAPNQAPFATAGIDITITLPVNSVTLNGSGSDADGTIKSYTWSKASGPSSGSVVSANTASTAVNNLVQGVYKFVLTVADNSLATANDTVQVTVNPAPNLPPLAAAGSDVIITLPLNSVTLNGSGSDADGTIKSYAWAKASGPSSGSVASANTASTAVNNLVQGVYKFVLTVADNSLATANDTVQVTVNPAPNQAPFAAAGSDMSITLPMNSVTLNGSASDADGTIKSYAWAKASGPSSGSVASANTASTAVNNLVQGVYKFVLTVADNSLATANDTVQVTVNPAPNQPPLAAAGSDVIITLPLNSVTLNGSGSDADGTIKSYAWSKASGPSSGSVASASTASTAVNNLVQGVYKFVLTVADNSLATANDTVQVTVNAAVNVLPVAIAGNDTSITLPVKTYVLNGTGVDLDGTITSYTWLKIAGPSSGNVTSPNTAITDVSRLVEGTYQFKFTVTDNSGALANDTIQIIVNAALNRPPVANAGTDVTITLPVNSVTLNGNGADADGTIKSYAWSKISGPSSGSILAPDSASTTTINFVQGTYQFALTVTDDAGATGTDTVEVFVNAAVNLLPFANAGTDTSIRLPVKTYMLNGSGGDADGIITGYAWSKIAGPSSGTLTSSNTSTTGISRLEIGVYQFQLTVTDNSGATATDTIQIIVNAALNRIPVANAGTDVTITLPEDSMRLNGNGSDVDGTITRYSWAKISGPSSGSILLPDSSSTTVTALIEGIYQFVLTVSDDSSALASDTIQVFVNPAVNKAPLAFAGNDTIITLPINSLSLKGIGSDTDGSIANYKWIKIAGPAAGSIISPDSSSTNVTDLVQGVYQFVLKVTDNSAASSNDTIEITVNALVNLMPVAKTGNDTTIILPLNSITLNGSGTDADGTIAGYAWSKISGPSSGNIMSSSSASTMVTDLVQGVYKFALTVTDNLMATANDTIQVVVNTATNEAPIAKAGNDTTIYLPVNYVALNGSGTDADGTIASYRWKKISGKFAYLSNKNSAKATAYVSQSIYQFELTVTDNKGLQGKDTVQVTVLSKIAARIQVNLNKEIINSNSAENLQLTNQSIAVDHLMLPGNHIMFNLTSSKQQKVNMAITDAKGSTFFINEFTVQRGVNNISRFVPALTKGVYYIKFFTSREMIAKSVLNQ